jgi:hypothetical protein
MILEQIRYFVSADNRESAVALRRRIAGIRRDAGVPEGKVLLADDDGDDCPQVVWQCGYENEAEMGMAETQLIGNTAYEEARAELGALGIRVVLELYTVDEVG